MNKKIIICSLIIVLLIGQLQFTYAFAETVNKFTEVETLDLSNTEAKSVNIAEKSVDTSSESISIDSITVDEKIGKKGDVLNVRLNLTNYENIDVRYINLNYSSPSMNKDLIVELNYNTESESYVGTIPIYDYMVTGEYKLWRVSIYDTSGNIISFTELEYELLFENGSFEVIETTGSELIQSISTDKKIATNGDKLKIHLKVRNHESIDIRYINFSYSSPNIDKSLIVKLEYNSNSDSYEGNIPIYDYMESGEYKLWRITIYETAGNTTSFSGSEYESIFENGNFHINGTIGSEVIQSITVDEKSATIGDTVNISAKVNDIEDIRYILVWYTKPISNETLYLYLHYNSQSGMFEGSIPVNEEEELGKYIANRYTVYYNNDITFGIDSTNQLENGSFEIFTEANPPTFVGISVGKREVSVGDNLRIYLKAVDDTNLSRASVNFITPQSNSTQTVTLKYDQESDSLIGDFNINETTEIGEWNIDSIKIEDTNRNATIISNDNTDLINGKFVVKDTTPPLKPTVNEVTDKDTVVTGKSEVGSTVIVRVKDSVEVTESVYIDGSFKIPIPVQTAGTILTIIAIDNAGNGSEATTVIVKDVTAPSAPKVNKVTDQSTTVIGLAEKDSNVTVKIGSNTLTGNVNSEGKFTVDIPKQKAGTVVEVTAKDNAGNVSTATKVTVVDATAPAAPKANKVTDQSTTVTGTAEKGATITVKIGSTTWNGIVNSEGKFSIGISKQKAGTVVEVTAKDNAGNVSTATKVTVVDATAPAAPKVNVVTDQSTTVTGTAEKGATITVKIGSTTWNGIVNSEGKFSIGISKQKAGTVVEVTAKDNAENVSTATKLTVVDATAPSAPKVNKVSDQSTTVTGTAEKSATITVKIGSTTWNGNVNSEGEFSIGISKQKAGTVVEVTAKDNAGNVSTATKVMVVDATAPAAPKVNKVTDQSTTVTGTAERGSVVTVKVGTSAWNGNVNSEGKFSIGISKQKAGTVVEVTAKDNAENVSTATKVTVVDATAPSAPKVNAVTDLDEVITGSTEVGATVVAKVAGKEIGRATTDSSGKFSITTKKQTAGSTIEVIAVDKAGNSSPATKIKVTDKRPSLQKLVGKSRYLTAVEVSKAGWNTADTVLLVNGAAIADGLTATPLASAENAPILLTRTDRLPDETMLEIQRLKAKKVILIGGTGVISDSVKKALTSKGISVTRIGGKSRYDTSLLIAQQLDKLVDVHTAYMAYGFGEPDALSIAAQSGQTKQPIILTAKKSVPANSYKWLKSEGLKTAYFIGGTTVIAPEIIQELNKITSENVLNNRLSGKTRQITNAKVIEKFYNNSEMQSIMVAHSQTAKLVDALSAGPLAAKLKVPVLLVSSKLDSTQANVISPYKTNQVHQIGGGIDEKVLQQVVNLMN